MIGSYYVAEEKPKERKKKEGNANIYYVQLQRAADVEFRVPYSQRYLVLGLVGLVGLALWLVSGIALNKYRCEYGTLNSMFAQRKTQAKSVDYFYRFAYCALY